jgi:hypothetical protein
MRPSLAGRRLGYFAAAGFVIAVLIHIATIAGVDVSSSLPSVWALHAGAILVGLALVFSMRGTFGRRLRLSEIPRHLPSWALATCAVVYA